MTSIRMKGVLNWTKAHWPQIRKLATACFIVLVLVLLGFAATRIEWTEVLGAIDRSEEHTSELQSLMRISYAVFCLKKKKPQRTTQKVRHVRHHNHKKSTIS